MNRLLRLTIGRSRWWKLGLPLTLALAALAVAGLADSSNGPNAQLMNQDRIYGGGQFITAIGAERNFAVDAHATSTGQAAYGNITYGQFAGQHEQVSCLNVNGNQAAVGAIITDPLQPSTVVALTLRVMVDSGTPGVPDESTLQVIAPPNDPSWPAGFPDVCPTPEAAATTFALRFFPLTGGDLVVQDAP